MEGWAPGFILKKRLIVIWLFDLSIVILTDVAEESEESYPLTPMSVQDRISPYNINAISNRQEWE